MKVEERRSFANDVSSFSFREMNPDSDAADPERDREKHKRDCKVTKEESHKRRSEVKAKRVK